MLISACNRCLMDATAIDFVLEENGCNFCGDFLAKLNEGGARSRIGPFKDGLTQLVARLKRTGRAKDYDCVVGMSGGVDSAWVLHQAVMVGLRPLAVHMDNGWNSELATHNISSVVTALDVDLHTYVIDWGEYRDLMRCFLDADVIDVELLYDNAAMGVLHRAAESFGIATILSGANTATEGLRMPKGWSWKDKRDATNIKALARWGGVRINSFPLFSNLDFLYARLIKGIISVPFLDYFAFSKEEALSELESRYGFRRYPYKHYESIFTRLYQGHILPQKFGVDKRRVHLSTLVLTGEMSRAEASKMLAESPYPNSKDLTSDWNFFLKKLNWTESEGQDFLSRPAREHDAWKSEAFYQGLFLRIRAIVAIANKLRRGRGSNAVS